MFFFFCFDVFLFLGVLLPVMMCGGLRFCGPDLPFDGPLIASHVLGTAVLWD